MVGKHGFDVIQAVMKAVQKHYFTLERLGYAAS